VALACGVAQLSVFAHLALVRHATCPEHGDLVHVEGDAPAALHHHDAAPDANASLTGVESEHVHDHCAVGMPARERMIALAPWTGTTLPGHRVAARPRAPPHGRDVAVIAALRLAPKNSPPAV
jgi:hypothetical protein